MTGHQDLEELSEPEMAALSALLASESVWEDPDPDVEQRVLAAVDAEAGARVPVRSIQPGRAERRHLRILGIAAAVLLAVGIGIGLLAGDGRAPLEIALAGTDLAPDATAVAELEETPQGLRVRMDISGLAPAAQGTYYQAWVRRGSEAVTIGTFHLRGGDAEVELWGGVSSDQYSAISVTLQQEGAGAESSGQVVLRGSLEKG
ncbi:MAG: anti-sigma factor [Acidimicrobiales bacterium]